MLRWLFAQVVSIGLLVCVDARVHAQGVAVQSHMQAAQEKEDKYEFFSGTVTVVSKEKVTVLRAIPGKPGETKVFTIKDSTIVEGKIEMEARVTVGYVTEETEDIAVRIIVREGR